MYERMQRLLQSLATDLHERDEPIRLGLLASAAGESLFLLGSPGTGKSLIARRLQQAFLDARSFSYLMGRFSTPDEVFGPLSIRALREEDRYERSTASYLPDSDVVFLDEIWKASPPIQNALLTALNERRFRNGTQELQIPLKVFIGASNELPTESDEAAAFWDRFLVRLVVDPIREADAFASFLAETSDPYRAVVEQDLRISDQEYETLRAAETSIRIPPSVVDLISAIREELTTGTETDPPVYVSDRRWKKIAGLLRMSAVLHDRVRVEPIDCAIIRACAWSTLEERPRVDRVVADQLASRSGRQLVAQRLTDRLDELRASYRDLSVQMVEDEQARPRVYRNEYYRLLPHGTTAEAYTSEASEEQLLVWRGDADEIRSRGSQTIDLFVYDADDQLVGSQQSEVGFVDEWTVLVEGNEYVIETAVARVTEARTRTLEGDEQGAIAGEISALVEEIDRQVEELIVERAELEDTRRSHLFVSAADADVVLDAIRETSRRLGELKLLAIDFADSISGA